jgi:hypothetical protein
VRWREHCALHEQRLGYTTSEALLCMFNLQHQERDAAPMPKPHCCTSSCLGCSFLAAHILDLVSLASWFSRCCYLVSNAILSRWKDRSDIQGGTLSSSHCMLNQKRAEAHHVRFYLVLQFAST